MKPQTIELFDIRFDNVTFEEVRTRIGDRLALGEPGYVVTPNVDHVCRFQRDAALREAYADAFLVLSDGMPVLWASWLLGKPLCAKVSGSDLVPLLCEFAAQRGHSVFFFGAAEGVAEEAADNLCRRYPDLQVAGVYCPPMGFHEDPAENAKALEMIRSAAPDICFVALGAPKQEIWMRRHCRGMGAKVSLGIGAALDFAAGRRRRAPVWMQNWGLEWLWRLAMEPRRLWRRYLLDDPYFLVLVWREWRKSAKRPERETND